MSTNKYSSSEMMLKWLLVAVLLQQTVTISGNPVSTKSTPLELIILHNNDMHARFEQTGVNSNTCAPEDVLTNKCYGGFARVSSKLKYYRDEMAKGGTPVLYLNAGDTYTGTPWFTLYRDKIVTEFLNLLKPDAISLGNHEFDNNIDGLVPFLNEAHFPVLIANMDASLVPELETAKSLQKSVIFNINGVNVGVIGYLTTDTKFLAPPNRVEFIDEIVAINKEAAELKAKGVNIIIALGHSGVLIDRRIAEECTDVDIVVGGHSHTFLYSGTPPDAELPEGPYPTVVIRADGKKVPVVQAYAYTKYLGHMKLSFDDMGNLLNFDGTPILLDGEVARDPDVLSILEKYRPGITALQNTIVGESKVFLNGSCRFNECNLGNFIADSMVSAHVNRYKGPNWTDASIAFIQGGGIRTSTPPGNITVFDLTTILPFESTVMVISVTGNELLLALEHSVARYSQEIGRGEFLQMSGIHVAYNLTKTSGSRVESVQTLCTECEVPRFYDLDISKTYKVIISSFLNEGGDGFDMFMKTDRDLFSMTEVQVTRENFQKLGVIYPAVEWRITMTGKASGAGYLQVSMIMLLVAFVISLYN